MDTSGPKALSIESANQAVFPAQFDAPPEVVEQPLVTELMPTQTPEVESLVSKAWLKARKLGGRVALAGVCMIPVIDLAASDAVSAKIYEVTSRTVHADSPTIERAITYGMVGGDIVVESLAVGWFMTRRKRAKEVFAQTDEYMEMKRSTMSPPRKLFSRVINAPFDALANMSDKLEARHNDSESAQESRISRTIGRLAVDTVKVNAFGTSGIVLEEMMEGKTTSMNRVAKLSGLLAATWLGGVEAIRQLYIHFPKTQAPLDNAFEAFTTLTTPDNPYGKLALGSLMACLGVTGWRLAKFDEDKQALNNTEEDELGRPTATAEGIA